MGGRVGPDDNNLYHLRPSGSRRRRINNYYPRVPYRFDRTSTVRHFFFFPRPTNPMVFFFLFRNPSVICGEFIIIRVIRRGELSRRFHVGLITDSSRRFGVLF